ncbi:hypothetical protein [Absidia glauca]|uniref:Uncharacterized protein n=1 Tax=Absidia glauca TaxID=4829 RepID=A0A168NU08_ABSGL|nr:hypothetical protein [Absidia glauca]
MMTNYRTVELLWPTKMDDACDNDPVPHRSFATPVRHLLGTLGWNGRYDETVNMMKHFLETKMDFDYAIDLIYTLQFGG